MATVLVPAYGEVHIPGWVTDLGSFRRWVHSGVLPEKLPVHFIRGEVWVDFSMEEAFTHNRVKTAVASALDRLTNAAELGIVFSDRMLLSNVDAGLSTEPDAMFVSFDTLRAGRAAFDAGEATGASATELVGTPDVVLEVISPSSEDKDTEKLMSQYHDAGIAEYWLIDARGDDIRFDIYRHGAKGYVPGRKREGWVRSKVFALSFRLTRRSGKLNYPLYVLDAR